MRLVVPNLIKMKLEEYIILCGRFPYALFPSWKKIVYERSKTFLEILQYVELYWFLHEISDGVIESIVTTLRNLQVLVLCYCLGDISILGFKFSMPNLRKLQLHWVTPWLTNNDLVIMTQSCRNLIELSLLGCKRLNPGEDYFFFFPMIYILNMFKYYSEAFDVTSDSWFCILQCWDCALQFAILFYLFILVKSWNITFGDITKFLILSCLVCRFSTDYFTWMARLNFYPSWGFQCLFPYKTMSKFCLFLCVMCLIESIDWF